MNERINLAKALTAFDDTWSPRTVATVNDYDVKLVHIEGEFVWHKHDETDELFLLIEGAAEIELRDRTIDLKPGELFVVPKGVEHKPQSKMGASLLLFEPSETTNTGTTSEAIPDHIETTTGTEI